VRAGAARVTMAASSVAEVIRPPRLTRMPNGPRELLGVMHLRGIVLPVLSLRQLLDPAQVAEQVADQVTTGAATRIVVLRRDPPLGLSVDAVESLEAGGAVLPEGGELLLRQAEGDAAVDLAAVLRARFAGMSHGAARAAQSRPQTTATASAPAARRLAFLAFTLAGQDYALPLDSVAEVLALPPAIAALPRTEALLLGVFELRDAVLPALSLRRLLGLPDRPPEGGDQVLVTQVAGQRVALVVDRILGIQRVAPDRVGPVPRLFNTGGGEARISQVLRQADGRGLVAILSPQGLLADDRIAHLLDLPGRAEDQAGASPPAASAAEPSLAPGSAPAMRRERFVVIRLGTESYGLPICAVDEVLRLPESLTRLPKAPDYVRGVLNLRGRVIPVIDQRRRFHLPGKAEGGGRIVVITLGALQAGFAVDAVTEMLELAPDDILPAPEIAEHGMQLFDRALARDGRVILLIDPAALLTGTETDLLRDLTAASSPP